MGPGGRNTPQRSNSTYPGWLDTTIEPLHNWDLTPTEAVDLQRQLRDRIKIPQTTTPPKIKTIAGLDCAFDREGGHGYAGVVVYEYPSMTEVRRVGRRSPLTFPYVPGLLSFREVPLLLAALDKLDTWPDLFMLDGHGLAHPRRFGIACHLGLLIDRPTIGCAKSRLVGDHREPGQRPGSHVPLTHHDEVVGRVLRTKRGCKPVFVSAGHRISLEAAVDVVKNCVKTYRIPQPTRGADMFVAKLKKQLTTDD